MCSQGPPGARGALGGAFSGNFGALGGPGGIFFSTPPPPFPPIIPILGIIPIRRTSGAFFAWMKVLGSAAVEADEQLDLAAEGLLLSTCTQLKPMVFKQISNEFLVYTLECHKCNLHLTPLLAFALN